MRSKLLLLILVSLLAWAAPAQLHAQRRGNTYRTPPRPTDAPKPFPEVHRDRTVTFRVVAPRSTKVALRLDGEHAMTRDASGVWTVTIGPLAPEVYEYFFMIDGVKVLDARNPSVKMGEFAASLLDVGGVPARFDQARDVPHGTLQLLTYTSSSFQKRRTLYVYVPPQYDSEPTRRFPVLYLRHGNGDDETAWPFQGRAGIILENLLAEKKAMPMLIVMPYGESTATGGGMPEGYERVYRELQDDVMPLVESRFRVFTDRENRAIAGLSMGGGQAFTIGLRHLDSFGWVGEFSSGLLSDDNFRIASYLPKLVADPEGTNAKLRLLFLSCGTEDPRYAGHLNLVDDLKSLSIRHVWYSTPGAHEFKVWRHSLLEFLPLLFRR